MKNLIPFPQYPCIPIFFCESCVDARYTLTPYYHLNFIYDFAAYAYAHVYRDTSFFCKSGQISVIYGDCTFRWSGYIFSNEYIVPENLVNVSRK